jgi:drug/metabolite transporter (DMT)-like permease
MTDRRDMLLGYIYAAMGAALFSTKAIFIKLAYQEVANAPLMLGLRMAFSLPFFLVAGIVIFITQHKQALSLPSRRAWLGAIGSGFFGYYLSSLLDLEGLTYITAQLERLVLFTYPVLVMLLGAWFFGGKLTKQGLIAGAISYLGLAVVLREGLSGGGQNVWLGTSLVFGCAITFALYQLLAKKYISLMGASLFTCVALSSSAVTSLIHYGVVTGGMDLSASPRFLWLAFCTAIFATVLPSFLINWGMARIGPQSTSMVSGASPILTIWLAVELLGEPFTLIDALGAALIIGSVSWYGLMDVQVKTRMAAD